MPTTDRTTAAQRGFSLVELMVVMAILAVGLLPLAFIQTRAQQNVADSGRFTEALALAQMQMESAKSLGSGNVATDSGLVDVYTWRRDVTTLVPGPVPARLDRITLSVNWTEHGRPQSLQIINMMSAR
ncbi:MAG: prepilin-type N-terminal cleavage/methylation domain-containing protein [Candidatus Krumholzibacteria bacterium]|nr:prepilin-type N-terminal cleavage/methylation domain-containing protein [Candidatus Krumholzibacteria bacterium]MDH4338303.1 prepilin-type N-terminal cleavage/methylation domain-containing protein [Candidatus Krumholzibacteria bacterium]MDH5268936.1 prepilin-type N-terminal cleavage/methylation domain-containing protein [Candidatus Krumholzibacteria bacterium]